MLWLATSATVKVFDMVTAGNVCASAVQDHVTMKVSKSTNVDAVKYTTQHERLEMEMEWKREKIKRWRGGGKTKG